uniref:RNA polymerase II subunit A C-terminal domain phosphatase SSU72 n=1 Tax=Macaca mulatta TaxID=9544 RepID=A0A5F7ZIA4_MACMU
GSVFVLPNLQSPETTGLGWARGRQSQGLSHIDCLFPGSGASDVCVTLSQSDLNSREQETCQPVHVVNVDIQDNHEEATLGAFLICELCQCIQHTEDMENEIDELLQEFEEKSGRTFLHTVCFY